MAAKPIKEVIVVDLEDRPPTPGATITLHGQDTVETLHSVSLEDLYKELEFTPEETASLLLQDTMEVQESEGPLGTLEELRKSLQDVTAREVETPDSGRGSVVPPPPRTPSPLLRPDLSTDPYEEIRGLLAPAEPLHPGLTAKVLAVVKRLVSRKGKPAMRSQSSQTKGISGAKAPVSMAGKSPRTGSNLRSQKKAESVPRPSTEELRRLKVPLQPSISTAGTIPRRKPVVPSPTLPIGTKAAKPKSKRQRTGKESRPDPSRVTVQPPPADASPKTAKPVTTGTLAETTVHTVAATISSAAHTAPTVAATATSAGGAPAAPRQTVPLAPKKVPSGPGQSVGGYPGATVRQCYYCRQGGHAYRTCPKYLADLEHYGGQLPPALEFCYECGRRGRTLRTCPFCREKWAAKGPFMPSVGTNVPRYLLQPRGPVGTPPLAEVVANVTAAVLAQLQPGGVAYPSPLGTAPEARSAPGPSRRRRRGKRSGK